MANTTEDSALGNARAQDGLSFLLGEVRRNGLNFQRGGITVGSNEVHQSCLGDAFLALGTVGQVG